MLKIICHFIYNKTEVKTVNKIPDFEKLYSLDKYVGLLIAERVKYQVQELDMVDPGPRPEDGIKITDEENDMCSARITDANNRGCVRLMRN